MPGPRDAGDSLFVGPSSETEHDEDTVDDRTKHKHKRIKELRHVTNLEDKLKDDHEKSLDFTEDYFARDEVTANGAATLPNTGKFESYFNCKFIATT